MPDGYILLLGFLSQKSKFREKPAYFLIDIFYNTIIHGNTDQGGDNAFGYRGRQCSVFPAEGMKIGFQYDVVITGNKHTPDSYVAFLDITDQVPECNGIHTLIFRR